MALSFNFSCNFYCNKVNVSFTVGFCQIQIMRYFTHTCLLTKPEFFIVIHKSTDFSVTRKFYLQLEDEK